MTQPMRKVDILDKLLRVFSEGQLGQLADVLAMTQENAVARRCDQRVEIVLDSNGYPRFLNGSNNFRLSKPLEEK
jgi:hypothetical protein